MTSELDRIVACAIHPALGIARLGKSPTDFYLAPEVPGADADPGNGKFKDADGNTKREGARFRIYGYAVDGSVVKEITSVDADIVWRVHVANRKAAWYCFEDAFDLGPSVKNARRRNARVRDRESLVLDPGAHRLAGPKAAARVDAEGFDGGQWHLADLSTDDRGRLIFLGGHGVARSATNSPPTTFANNDGWIDDTCDGPVRATVTLRNAARTVLEADAAMVAVAPPNFGQGLRGVVTMYDVLTDMFAREFGWQPPPGVSYWRDIFPIFDRLSGLAAVNQGAFMLFGPGSPSNFLDPVLQGRLMDPSKAAKDVRERVFRRFRAPAPSVRDAGAMPPVYGDLFSPAGTDPRPEWDLSVTELEYSRLTQWAAGNFVVEAAHRMPVAQSLDAMELADRPHALDRTPLENILGGPFRPGIELTWTMRLTSMWRKPFRLNVLPEGVAPRLRWGPVLAREIALAADGPFSASGPGTLTCFLGIPWQTDQANCLAGYELGTFLPLPTFWAARAPNQVLPERAYQRFMDGDLPVAQRFKHLNLRAPWLRFLSTQVMERIESMVAEWNDLGIIVARAAPADAETFGLGAKLFVETEVASALERDDATFKQLLAAEGKPAPRVRADKGSAAKSSAAKSKRSRRRVYGSGEI